MKRMKKEIRQSNTIYIQKIINNGDFEYYHNETDIQLLKHNSQFYLVNIFLAEYELVKYYKMAYFNNNVNMHIYSQIKSCKFKGLLINNIFYILIAIYLSTLQTLLANSFIQQLFLMQNTKTPNKLSPNKNYQLPPKYPSFKINQTSPLPIIASNSNLEDDDQIQINTENKIQYQRINEQISNQKSGQKKKFKYIIKDDQNIKTKLLLQVRKQDQIQARKLFGQFEQPNQKLQKQNKLIIEYFLKEKIYVDPNNIQNINLMNDKAIQEKYKRYTLKKGISRIKNKQTLFLGQIDSITNARNGQGINYFKNGDIYLGNWKNDQLSGQGIYIFKNGARYQGTLKQFKKQGIGKYYFADGNIYQGAYINDKKNGYGRYKYNNQQVYMGEWYNDQKHGDGQFLYNYGIKYRGQFKNGLRHGNGQILYEDGSKFQGFFMNDKVSSKGRMQYCNGDIYIGQWFNSLKQGYGIYNYSNGDTYQGTFHNDKPQGTGTYTFYNGDRYEGQFNKGLFHGKGKYTYKQQYSFFGLSYYAGQWIDGKKKGIGQLNISGDAYEGEWVNDMKMGYGIYKWANGDFYQGSFINEIMQGRGTYNWRTGQKIVGQWNRGRLNGSCLYQIDDQKIDMKTIDGKLL